MLACVGLRRNNMNRKKWINLLLVTIGMLVFFILAEIGVRIYTSVSKNFDIEMLTYAKKLKRRASIPGLSHEHIPGSSAEIMRVRIDINQSGFRGPGLPPVKPQNEHRILVLGSSITIGWGVPFENVFTTLLEKRLNQDAAASGKDGDNPENRQVYRVINSGIANYNTLLEALYLKKKLYRFQPDTVVLHYFINDAEILSPGGAGFLIRHSRLAALVYNRVSQFIEAKKNKYKHIGEYYRDLYRDDSRGWQEAKQAILDIHAFCQQSGIRFMVLMQPDLHDLSAGSLQEQCHHKIKSFLETHRISYHDLMPAFRERFGADPSAIWVNPDDSHPTAPGHQVMAEGLYKIFNIKTE